MKLSVLLTSLPFEFELAVRQAAALGFERVDVVGLTDRPAAHLEALADAGLIVGCGAVGKGLPPGLTLDAPDVGARRAAAAQVEEQISDAARLGATHCYLVPDTDASPAGLGRFADACTHLADHADRRMVRLCVEHVPGKALPTAAGVLDWLNQLGHANLHLLLDVGHCLISAESPVQVLAQAGDRLGYVHLDDNDSRGDLHWPLLTGTLTEEQLRATLLALRDRNHLGGIALELHPSNPDPVEALRRSKAIVERLVPEGG